MYFSRTVLAQRIIYCVEKNIVPGDWTNTFHQHDYNASGKIELHAFRDTFRRTFMLPKENDRGGCSDRELRDVFFHLDTDYSGDIKINELLDYLFRHEQMPSHFGEYSHRA